MPDLTHIWDQIAPWLAAGAILYVIFGVLVFSLVIGIFIFVIKEMRKMDKAHDDMSRRMFPR